MDNKPFLSSLLIRRCPPFVKLTADLVRRSELQNRANGRCCFDCPDPFCHMADLHPKQHLLFFFVQRNALYFRELFLVYCRIGCVTWRISRELWIHQEGIWRTKLCERNATKIGWYPGGILVRASQERTVGCLVLTHRHPTTNKTQNGHWRHFDKRAIYLQGSVYFWRLLIVNTSSWWDHNEKTGMQSIW